MNRQTNNFEGDTDHWKLEPKMWSHFEEHRDHDDNPTHLDRLFMAGFKTEDVATITSKCSSPTVSKLGTIKPTTRMSLSKSPSIIQKNRLSMMNTNEKLISGKDEGQHHHSSSVGHEDPAFSLLDNDNSDQIFWRRKQCNSRSQHRKPNLPLPGSVPPPPPSSLKSPSIRNCGAPRNRPSFIRCNSASRQRSRTPTVQERKRIDSGKEWNGSPEEFPRTDEIFWRRKGNDVNNRRIMPTKEDAGPGHSSAPCPPPPAPSSSCAVVPHITNSVRSRSETSLVSSSSSASSGSKSPRLKRKGLGIQTLALRKQMREQQRTELKSSSVPNSGATPTPILEERSRSQWHVLSDRGATTQRGSKTHPSRKTSDRFMEVKVSHQSQNSRSHQSHSSSRSSSSTSPEIRPRLMGDYRDPTGAVVNFNGSPITEVPPSISRTRSNGRTRGGPSMRSLLRNKRKLERELHQSDVFHYVLHKCPLSSFQKQTSIVSLGNTTATSTSSNSRGTVPDGSERANVGSTSSDTTSIQQSDSKMPLERFLIMKRRSEELVVQKREGDGSHQRGSAASASVKCRHHEPQPVEDTWHDSHSMDNFVTFHDRRRSVGHQSIESALCLLRALDDAGWGHADEIDDEDKTIESEDLNDTPEHPPSEKNIPFRDDDEADSFISLDGKNLPSVWSHDLEGSASFSRLVTSANCEDQNHGGESETLSQSLNDLIGNEQQGGDTDEQHEALEDSCGNIFCEGFLAELHQEVENLTLVDPSGRQSTYSGSISSSSGMPDGMGRLEYHDRGTIFIGQFVHGWWSGYGTCQCTRTGEEYTGFFSDYVKHGHGVCKYADGSVFEGTFDTGCRVEGRMTYPDQSIYVGKFDKDNGGKRCGRGTYTFSNGAVFFGEFQDDNIHSGVLTYTNGGRFLGLWSKGLRHGPGKEFRPDGSLDREGVWQEGRFIA